MYKADIGLLLLYASLLLCALRIAYRWGHTGFPPQLSPPRADTPPVVPVGEGNGQGWLGDWDRKWPHIGPQQEAPEKKKARKCLLKTLRKNMPVNQTILWDGVPWWDKWERKTLWGFLYSAFKVGIVRFHSALSFCSVRRLVVVPSLSVEYNDTLHWSPGFFCPFIFFSIDWSWKRHYGSDATRVLFNGIIRCRISV